MMTLHFLNEIDTKIDNYVIIASLKSEPMGTLMTRIPDSRLLISSLPCAASRMHVKLLGKPCDSTSILEALPGKLDIKRHSPSILYANQSCIHRSLKENEFSSRFIEGPLRF